MATSIMAARDGRWTPIASTPSRDNADVNSIAFIKAFFEDFPGSIATRAADYTKIFENKGFDSKESLKGILTADQVEKWKIPEGHAIQIVQQILLLFAPVALPVFTPVGGGASIPHGALTHVWSQKSVKPMEVENLKSSTGSREELDRFVRDLIPIVEANDIDPARVSSGAIGRFAGKPVCEGPELDALKAVMCPKFSGQLAALIQGNIPAPLAELVVFKVGVHAGALDILAALYSPHLQPAAVARQNSKDRELVECSGSQKPLGFRYLLYSFLIRWLAAIKRLTANSELPSDMARKEGLLKAIQFLNYTAEMTQLERDTKRANKLWDCAAVLKELEAVASDWATEEVPRGASTGQNIPNASQLPKGTVPNPPGTGKRALAKMAQAAGVALVATPGTCHKWLTSAGCSSTIHPPPAVLSILLHTRDERIFPHSARKR